MDPEKNSMPISHRRRFQCGPKKRGGSIHPRPFLLTLLEKFLLGANLIDPWHLTPQIKSTPSIWLHTNLLDYFFTSPSLLPHIREATIHKLVISDHSPIFVQVSDFLPKDMAKIWRFPSFLAHNGQLKRVLQEA